MSGLSAEMGTENKRIISKHRAQIWAAILIASSEINDLNLEQCFNRSLQTVQNMFSTLVGALKTRSSDPGCIHVFIFSTFGNVSRR